MNIHVRAFMYMVMLIISVSILVGWVLFCNWISGGALWGLFGAMAPILIVTSYGIAKEAN